MPNPILDLAKEWLRRAEHDLRVAQEFGSDTPPSA